MIRAVAVTLCAGVSLVGCGDVDPLAERAEEVRELAFLYDVEIVEMSRAEYAAQAEARAAQIDPADLVEYAETYGRMGFFDRSLDLVPIFAGSSSDWVGASYSPGTKVITLVGEARDDTIVHEYVHALQDQHFGIGEYDLYDTSDGFLARRAIVEGDAVLAETRFMAQEQVGGDLDRVNWTGYLGAYRDFATNMLVDADYPGIFLDYPTFCYAYGLAHDAYNLTGVTLDDPSGLRAPPYDWSREDALFTDRPANTTQQVLLLSEDVDPVVEVGLTDVPAAAATRLAVVDRESLGEWLSYILLFNANPDDPDQAVAEARALAAAWDGDRVLFVRDIDTGAHGFVWGSAWDTPEAAAAVADALWRIYGRRTVRLEPDRFAYADDGESVWIDVRGERIAVVRNVDIELVDALIEGAFAETTSRERIARAKPSIVELVSRRRGL